MTRVFTTTIYRVDTNSDLNEGRGGIVNIGYFVDEVTAREVAKGRGVFGSDGYIVPMPNTFCLEHDGACYVVGPAVHIADSRTWQTERIREQALAKLTIAEKRALGL